MNNDDSLTPSWQTPLIIAIAVILVVLAALILSQIDNIQRRSLLPPKRLTVIDQEATIIAGEPDAVYLPSFDVVTATPSVTPQTAMTDTPEATAVPMVKPACDVQHKDWVPYMVQQGETLSSLAFKYGISKSAIIQANCLTLEKLIWGQIIYLPQDEASHPEAVQCGVPPNWIHYVVHPGDTLLQLAEEYGSTVYTIMNANCLESTHISPGRKLFLPPLKPTPAPTIKIVPSPTRSIPRLTPTATRTRPFFPTFTPSPIPSATATPTMIPVTGSPSPTATTPATQTNTATPMPPTATETLVIPTNTATALPTETATSIPTNTATATLPPPTSTATAVPPTPTSTPLPPSATFTATPIPPTPTSTPLPPTPTATNTPALATSTATVSVHPPAQPTATSTTAPALYP